MPTPLDWTRDQVRFDFFAQLPRPLAVMLACDIAALAPQPPLGAEAIDAARRWIMGAAEPREVRLAARAAALYAHSTADAAYAAAAAANTVQTSVVYLAYSASSVCEAVRNCAAQRGLDMNVVGYEAQSRRVEYLRQVFEEPQVRRLATISALDSAARPVLWDAVLDAGYSPQPTRRLEESPDDVPRAEKVRDYVARLWRNVRRS